MTPLITDLQDLADFLDELSRQSAADAEKWKASEYLNASYTGRESAYRLAAEWIRKRLQRHQAQGEPT